MADKLTDAEKTDLKNVFGFTLRTHEIAAIERIIAWREGAEVVVPDEALDEHGFEYGRDG